MKVITRFTAFLCVVLPLCANAQLQVQGTIKDASGGGIPFASVVILKQSDSTLVKGQLSTEQGTFELAVNEGGNYFVKISSAGYHTTSSPVFTLNNSTSPLRLSLTTSEQINTLNEVVVRGEKPFLEQRIDRTIINVQSMISRAGGTALDILQRSPGVTVDKMNNAIALSGKQGVRIMINGKISRLPMEAVVQMLAGMNAENIERIELITTPPSRYEAEGDAGMINIVLKQSTDQGTNGNASVFTGYGRDKKYGGNLNMNNRSKKFNIFGDFNTRQDYSKDYWDTQWSTPINAEVHETISKNNRPNYTGAISANLGAEWQVGKNTSLGGSFGMFDRKWDMDANADIAQNVDGALVSTVDMNTVEVNDWRQYIGNMNVNHHFNDKWDMTVNLDHIQYASTNPTTYTQNYFDSNGAATSTVYLRSRKDTQINIWTSSIDITGKLNDNISIEFGGKGSFTDLNNDIIIDSYEDPNWVVDPELTVFATMYENILAGYAATTINATKKLDIMMGIRYEHTVTNIDTQIQPNAVDRNYGKWFPSIFLNQRIDDNNSFVLSYSRRISRPSFMQLAPFVIFNDPNNFYSGNISLLPSFTDALKMEYRHKTFLISMLYSYDKNSISQFQPQVNEDGKQVSTSQNLDYRQTLGLVLTFPIQVTTWWEIQLNATGNMTTLKANYLDSPIELSISSYTANAIQKFTISKTITAELTAAYESKQYFGVIEMAGLGAIDIGLEKRFPHSSLRASFTDLLQTNKYHFNTYIESESLHSKTDLDFETTIFTVTYSLNFGNGMLKGANKKTGSTDEQDRLR